VNDRRRLWTHAAQVATVATLVVIAAYSACAFGLRIFLTHRLIGQADGRIRYALSAHAGSLPLRPSPVSSAASARSNGDVDDAPVFFWYVPSRGNVVPLAVGAPALPGRSWNTRPVTRTIGATPFRFAAARRGTGWVVAGQSIAEISRVASALVLPELLFGVLLAIATFVGSSLVALRASAPLELIRRRQAEFTADASHELRTPLSVVEAEVDLALRRRRPPEEYEAVLRRIGGESRRLRRIVDDLLWLARADSGTVERWDGQIADVEEVVASCVERFEAVAARNGVSLAFAVEGKGSGTVQAPAELVDRLAGVLIDNACKYAGAEGSVYVLVQSTPTRVILRVDDSGPGIPADQRAAVFDRFHRATPDGPGSGLGLAIADTVVRMTAGTWSVADSPLGGARMEVSWRSVQEGGPSPLSDEQPVDHDAPAYPREAGRRQDAHLGAT
jgi:signal transduction histidine kinase